MLHPLHAGAASAVAGFLVHALLDMNNTTPALYLLFCAAAAFFPVATPERAAPAMAIAPRSRLIAGVLIAGFWIYACFLPYIAKTSFEMARLELVEGNGQRALDLYKTSHRFNPDNADTLNHLGRTWMYFEPALGLSYLERAVKANPWQANLHSSLADALAAQNLLNRALIASTRAVELHPARAAYHQKRAAILRNLNRLNEAEIEDALAKELQDKNELLAPEQ